MTPDLIERYITYISAVRRYSGRTCEIYRDGIEDFFRFIYKDDPICKGAPAPTDRKSMTYSRPGLDDRKYIEALTVNCIRGYEADMLDRGLKPRTVHLHISILSGFCRFLIKEGLMDSNPAKLVARPKMEKKLPAFYRKEQMDEYFRATDYYAGEPIEGDTRESAYRKRLERVIISTLYYTGIRRSELISLDICDLDRFRKTLRVRGKGDKMREIPIIASLFQEIMLYLQTVETMALCDRFLSSPLFVTLSGNRLYPGLVDRTVKNGLGAIQGITARKSPHVLRHTIATELLDDGADLNSIKELLGHSSLAATQVYTHNSIAKLQKIYQTAHPRAKNGGKNGD